MDKNIIIDWSKFKLEAKGSKLNQAKEGYINFCKILDRINFELVSDYIGSQEKVELVYKFNSNVVLNMSPNHFKNKTYKAIVKFKNNLIENGDEFIRFIGLSDGGRLIAQIKTFDSSEVEIDISRYDLFNTSRKDTYDYCKEKGYKILSPYIKDREKILIDFNCGHDPHGIIPSHLK